VNPPTPVRNGIDDRWDSVIGSEVATPGPEQVPELDPFPLDQLAAAFAAPLDSTPPSTAGEPATDEEPVGDDRPWVDSQFWILQFAVLALFLIRLAATVAFTVDATSPVLVYSTAVLFIGPAVYAGLRYGFRGALLTSLWITVLAVPGVVTEISGRQPSAAWAEVTQVLGVDAVGLLIGQQVSGRRQARRISQASRAAHQNAEALYRDLFDSNQAPILIVDGSGSVVEANASAYRVFRAAGTFPTGSADSLPGGSPGTVPERDRRTPLGEAGPIRLVDMIGPGAAAQILTRLLDSQVAHTLVPEPPIRAGSAGSSDRDALSDDELVEPVAFEVEGHPVYFRPTGTMLSRSGGQARMQVVFEDVTAETRRHDLMEAYTSRVVLGQEEERRHLAQELHDGPVQTLIHLCRQIDELEKSPELRPESTDVLADLRVIAEGTVAELRSIARGLRPSILDDLGLVASINQILSEAGARQSFETSFGVTGAERRVPAPIELALFRIAQEAITNAERHAGASHVAVGLNFDPGGLRLLIKDDGAGFELADHPEGDGGHSLGLPGMTERAHLIGGRLAVHSAPGAGTTVDIWVPATVIGPQ
jgi:signal transduction histidine kinase